MYSHPGDLDSVSWSFSSETKIGDIIRPCGEVVPMSELQNMVMYNVKRRLLFKNVSQVNKTFFMAIML